MLRFGVFSDTHIGRNVPRIVGDARRQAFRQAFKQAVNIFIEERVDYILHGGDLFEKRTMTPEDVAFVKDEFYRLVQASREKWGKDVKIFIVRGNHDGTPSSCVLEYITHPLASYLQIIGESIKEELQYFIDEKILVAGIGYHPFIKSRIKDQVENLAEIFKSSNDKKLEILLLHNYVEKIHEIPPYTPEHSIIDIDDLKKINPDIVVVGHYHERGDVKYKNDIKFIIPGATEAVDLGEKGPFGVYIIEVKEGIKMNTKFIELTPSQHISVRKIVSEEAKPIQWFKERVLDEVSTFIDELNMRNLPGILKIKVSGKTSDTKAFLRLLTEEEIRKIREENPKLLYLEVEEDITPLTREELREETVVSREEMFEELYREIGREPNVLELIEETSLALEEKASEKTGLLKDSDRSSFVEKWLRILLDKAGEEMNGNDPSHA